MLFSDSKKIKILKDNFEVCAFKDMDTVQKYFNVLRNYVQFIQNL